MQGAYGERATGEYRKLFAEDFTFVFSPADAGGDDPTPTQWGLVDEMESTDNMFRSEQVDKVEFTSYVLGVPARVDSLYYGPRAWKVRVDQAKLQIWTRTEQGDEPLIYIVDGTTEVFYFREDPSRLIDGRPTWYVFRWEDQPIGGAKSSGKSWGAVKNLYR